MSDPLTVIGEAVTEAYDRFDITGTSYEAFGGRPYRAPWYLIDRSTEDSEVNYPGDLIAEADDRRELVKKQRECRARFVHEALTAAGLAVVRMDDIEFALTFIDDDAAILEANDVTRGTTHILAERWRDVLATARPSVDAEGRQGQPEGEG